MISFAAEQHANLHRLAPEIHLCFFGILIMLVDPFVRPERRRVLGWLGFFGAVFAIFPAIHVAMEHRGMAYGNLINTDDFSIFMHVIIIGAAALVILGSLDYLDGEGLQRGEYYALVLFATAGMGILAGANELVTAFIGLEMSSISTYVLAGFRRRALPSNEASLKYFLLGSFATAFFLYGIAMVYRATGTTRIDGVQAAFAGLRDAGQSLPALAVLGLALIFVGLGFKVVVAPFQIYGPDVYEGAPTPVTALLASAPKAATFALMIRIFYVSFGRSADSGSGRWISAVLSMFIGNLAALVQTNVKRMLAYSSIAHAGYILVAFAASTVDRHCGCALLSCGLRADEGGSLSGGRAPGPEGRKAARDSRLRRPGFEAAGAGCVLFAVLALACWACPPRPASWENFWCSRRRWMAATRVSCGWW